MTPTPRDAPHVQPATFLTTLRRGIWHVTLDGVFYGDYRTRRHAAESVNAAAAALRGQGRTVNIVEPQPAS